MAGATTTTLSNLLQEDYLPGMQEELAVSSVLYNLVKKNTDDFQGKQVTVAVKEAFPEGIGARAEGGTLPSDTTSYTQLSQAVATLKYNYGIVTISRILMETAKSDKAAFAKSLDLQISDMTKNFILDYNRQMFNDTYGTLALFNGDPGTGTATATVDTPGTRFLKKGMRFDVLDANSSYAAVTGSTGLTINSINSATSFTAAANWNAAIEDNDVIVRESSHDGAGATREITGLRLIVAASGTYLNINRATNYFWQSQVDALADAEISETDIQEALDYVEVENGGKANLIITEPKVRRKYYNLLSGDKRFLTTKIQGGWSAIDYAGHPIVVDRMCPEGFMYVLDLNQFTLYHTSPPKWVDEDGAVLARNSTDDFTARLAYYSQFVCLHPNWQAVISGINIT